jgi:uncharacterized protein (TIGR02246 family)
MRPFLLTGEKAMRPAHLLLGLLSFSLVGIGADVTWGGEREEQISAAVTRFAEIWNKHDMAAFGALFARDADFVNVTGQLWKGRGEIQRRHSYLHGAIARESVPEAVPANYGIFKSSTYHFDRIDVRVVGPDVAIAHGAWTMQDDARTAEPRHGIMTFTLKRDGDNWLYEAVQNTEINRTVR